MQAKHGQIQIPIPSITDDPRWIGRFSREVRKSIAALRDRQILVTGQFKFPIKNIKNPWESSLIYEDDKFKVRFNLGTINNVCASNWDTKFDLPTDNAVRFVILTITSANGKITEVVISLQTTPMNEDFVTKDTPPPSHKILLGVVSEQQQVMIEDTNLNAVAVEVFRESKASTAVGSEPFSRYWRWQHTSV
jgi:hypothetical protein